MSVFVILCIHVVFLYGVSRDTRLNGTKKVPFLTKCLNVCLPAERA